MSSTNDSSPNEILDVLDSVLNTENNFLQDLSQDPHFQEKLLLINSLVSSIKTKTLFIKENILFLKKFNFKLDAFLKVMDVFDTSPINECSFPSPVKNVENVNLNISSNSDVSPSFKKHFKNTKTQKLAEEIFILIKKNENIFLEDLVKSFKMNKYKIVEILNVLIKEKIISKKYDKGFIYSLSK